MVHRVRGTAADAGGVPRAAYRSHAGQRQSSGGSPLQGREEAARPAAARIPIRAVAVAATDKRAGASNWEVGTSRGRSASHALGGGGAES